MVIFAVLVQMYTSTTARPPRQSLSIHSCSSNHVFERL